MGIRKRRKRPIKTWGSGVMFNLHFPGDSAVSAGKVSHVLQEISSRDTQMGCSGAVVQGLGGGVETSIFLSAWFIVFTFWVGIGKLGERVRQFFRWEERCGTREEAPVRLDLGCIDLMGRGVGWGYTKKRELAFLGGGVSAGAATGWLRASCFLL